MHERNAPQDSRMHACMQHGEFVAPRAACSK